MDTAIFEFETPVTHFTKPSSSTVIYSKAIENFGIYEGKEISTIHPILVQFEYEDDYCLAINSEFNICASGKNEAKAMKEFKEVAIETCLHYLKANDSILTESAIELKKLFQKEFIIE